MPASAQKGSFHAISIHRLPPHLFKFEAFVDKCVLSPAVQRNLLKVDVYSLCTYATPGYSFSIYSYFKTKNAKDSELGLHNGATVFSADAGVVRSLASAPFGSHFVEIYTCRPPVPRWKRMGSTTRLDVAQSRMWLFFLCSGGQKRLFESPSGAPEQKRILPRAVLKAACGFCATSLISRVTRSTTTGNTWSLPGRAYFSGALDKSGITAGIILFSGREKGPG
ncbi:hypothetical protein C8F04DRAFT_1189619 [Mycena alexandri]|uniref:Uncharacterized protein n=1 Tax=Mycena alexandri TaxID=1745969 RepID=A0AAD6WU45_9AGAR|nr:hypothetical protein C8F04DRAFT_1189619 [Mycena alexandri]